MKRINQLLIFIFVFLFCSCSEVGDRGQKQSTVDDFSVLTKGLTRSQNEVGNSLLGFSIDCFKEVASDAIDNCLVSPYSIATDLSMLSMGASEGTYDELTGVLGFKDFSYRQLGDYYSLISEKIFSSESILSVSNAVWLDNTVVESVKPEFKDDASNYFKSEINALDFNSEKSAETINDWVKVKTDGKIDRIISYDDIKKNNDIAVLTNAVSFNGKWADQGYSTEEMPFKSLSGNTANKVYFKGCGRSIREYNVSGKEKNEPSVVELGIDDNYSISFILPPAKQNLIKFVNSIDSKKWIRWMSSLTPGETASTIVVFKIPCFRSDAEYQCVKYLKNLGIKSLFEVENCDLSRMINIPVSVRTIKQKSAIDVNSKGSSASSATAIDISPYTGVQSYGNTIKEYQFIADRPFVYAIVENTTQTILFLGTVTE